jgi:formylglycine-generating enzyme required for sulfatase activity
VIPLLRDYRNDPDPGVHSAADWLLRKWKRHRRLGVIDQDLAGKPPGDRRWFLNRQGETFAVFVGPVEFVMGSPEDEPGRDPDETWRREPLAHSFALATRLVTVAHFHRFLGAGTGTGSGPLGEMPALGVTWLEAVRYCNWLSREEGIPPDQWCYPAAEDGHDLAEVPPAWLERSGYRLPTEAEWEYACRAGSQASRPYGSAEDLLGKYAWYSGKTEGEQCQPVGRLVPNDFGLFDMLGNAWEWCQNSFAGGETTGGQAPRVLRGGAYSSPARDVRSASRHGALPTARVSTIGFRVAKTCL